MSLKKKGSTLAGVLMLGVSLRCIGLEMRALGSDYSGILVYKILFLGVFGLQFLGYGLKQEDEIPVEEDENQVEEEESTPR